MSFEMKIPDEHDTRPRFSSDSDFLPVRQSCKSMKAKPEHEHECVEVKTVTYSPLNGRYYNKICILCIAWLA